MSETETKESLLAIALRELKKSGITRAEFTATVGLADGVLSQSLKGKKRRTPLAALVFLIAIHPSPRFLLEILDLNFGIRGD